MGLSLQAPRYCYTPHMIPSGTPWQGKQANTSSKKISQIWFLTLGTEQKLRGWTPALHVSLANYYAWDSFFTGRVNVTLQGILKSYLQELFHFAAQVVVTHINCYLNSFISNSICLSCPKVRGTLPPHVLLIESFRSCITLLDYFTSVSKLSMLIIPSTLLDVNYSSHNAMIICFF